MKPLKVSTTIPNLHSASYYYRLQVSLKTAEELGLNIQAKIDTQDATVSEVERIETFCESDLVLMYQPIGDVTIRNIRGVQGFIPSKRDGEWKWPPSIIVETDDNLFNLAPFNPAYKGLGVRDMQGNDLPDGHSIGFNWGGEQKVLWKDGEDGFDLARNRRTLHTYRSILEMADAVSCSTEAVKETLDREVKTKRTVVFPNLVRFQDYEQVDLKEDPSQIKILWQGGSAHWEDWYPLRKALGNITKKYPQVHWVIWGALFPWAKELIPAHRYTFKDWCDYREYRLRRVMVGEDINLAPLHEHVFNKCRSAIKWYEASVLKRPAATLAQNSGAYKSEIQDGETGLLFSDPDEFEEKLGLLIENATLRQTLGRNAKDWISENRDAMKEVPKQIQFWEQLREERRREQPRVSDEHWAEIEAEARKERELEEAPQSNGALQPA